MSQGKHSFRFELDESLALKGYEEPLKSVLMNLISNAIRYTPEGGQITVRWYEDAKGPHFQVDDTGIGISQEHISRLTERFIVSIRHVHATPVAPVWGWPSSSTFWNVMMPSW